MLQIYILDNLMPININLKNLKIQIIDNNYKTFYNI